MKFKKKFSNIFLVILFDRFAYFCKYMKNSDFFPRHSYYWNYWSGLIILGKRKERINNCNSLEVQKMNILQKQAVKSNYGAKSFLNIFRLWLFLTSEFLKNKRTRWWYLSPPVLIVYHNRVKHIVYAVLRYVDGPAINCRTLHNISIRDLSAGQGLFWITKLNCFVFYFYLSTSN